MIRNLAGNCIFVRGYKMNLIFDIQNTAWYHVKENEIEILSDSLETTKKEYLEAHGIVLNFPDFLKNYLPKVDTSYQSPQSCEAIIIDVDDNTKFNILTVLKQLDYLNPLSLQLRFFSNPEFEYLEEIIDSFDFLTLESVEIILPFNSRTNAMFSKDDFLIKASKVFRVFFHSISHDIEFERSDIQNIYYSTDFIRDHSFCGQVSALDFSRSPKHVFKSINFNSCLYKKIGIDVNGNIKNCPSLKKIIGNVNDEEIEFKFNSTLFETEKIPKDTIEVCQDCEFRHICTDCRAFTDSTSRPNSRPSKCNYNPYIAKWSHEEDYLSLAECGVISNEKEFSINHEKIVEINKKIWG